MKFARRATPLRIPRLQSVSLIDVVLFLLLYFISATELTPDESQLSAALRTDAQGTGSSSFTPQILTVSRGPVYRIGDRSITSRDALAALAKQLPKEAGVVIRVTDEADAGSVAQAIQVFHDAGFLKISYVPARRTQSSAP